MSRYFSSRMIHLLILSLASIQLVTASYCSNNCYDIYGNCAYYTQQCASSWQCRYCTYYGNCGTYNDCQDSGNDILTWILTSVFISLGCVAAVLLCFLIQRRRRMQRLQNQQLQQQLYQNQQIKEQATVATVEQSYVLGYQVAPPSNANGQGFYNTQQSQQPPLSSVTPQPQQQYNNNYQYQQPLGLQYQCVIPASNQPGQNVSQQAQQFQIQQQQQLQQQYYQSQQQQYAQQQQQPQIYDVKIPDANVEIAPR